MYGEIAPTLVNQFMDKIREGKIYEIRRFLVGLMKGWYKPVDGEFMIRFGRYTTVREIGDNVMDYPLCTYNLTPIDALPSPTDNPESFTGVVICFFWISFFPCLLRPVFLPNVPTVFSFLGFFV
jgi:replication factor A1